MKGDGVEAHTTSSTSSASSWHAALGRGRHGDDDRQWLALPQCTDGCPHARSSGQAVIDEYRHLALDRNCGTVFPVRTFSSEQHAALPLRDLLDHVWCNAETAHYFIVHDDDTAAGDGAHCQLVVGRNAELADDPHVQRRPESPRHLVGNGNTAAREPEDDDVVPVRVVAKQSAEHVPAVAPVLEHP